MRKLSIGQQKILSEFFANSAVAWLTAGIVTPFFISKKVIDFILFGAWGVFFTLVFLTISLTLSKGVNS